MANQEEKKYDDLLRKAKRRINFSLILATTFCLIVLQQFLFPDLFNHKGEIKVASNSDTNEITIDSTEIVDGIHTPSGLISADGLQTVLTHCGACHSFDLVKQNRATKEGWREIIRWMQKTQGLWDLGKDEEIILTYLSKNYAPQNSGRRKNLENIKWYRLKD